MNILVMILAKMGIYKTKHEERPPNIKQFLSVIKLEAEKVQRSAARRKAMDIFPLKWRNVSKILLDSDRNRTLKLTPLSQGRIQDFDWGGAAGPGGAVLAIERAPFP